MSTRSFPNANDYDKLLKCGKWCWWSRNIGGKNALDYLTKVEGVPFLDAVQRILGAVPTLPATPEQVAPVSKAEFALPPKHADNRRVFSYLHGRGIAPEIINHCTLVTCVMNQPDYRWCVQAKAA